MYIPDQLQIFVQLLVYAKLWLVVMKIPVVCIQMCEQGLCSA